jgi:hypothetical protein
MSKLRIAVVESPNVVDLFDGRGESEALVSACKLIGHQAVLFFAKSQREFREICKYLGAADTRHAARDQLAPLFLHISCHGNDDGVAFGSDSLKWDALVRDLEPVLSNSLYRGNFALSLSSCGSGGHNLDEHLTERLEKKPLPRMPQYIFSIGRADVAWADALLGWSLLYHKLSSVRLADSKSVRSALKDVLRGTGLSFSYHRWDDDSSSYCTYTPKPDN